MEKNSTFIRTSRYVSGGTTEVNSRALEWWERLIIRTADDDSFYVVEKTTEGRLDLVAAALLGEPRYWWIIAQLNNILDPATEVVRGTILRVPSKNRVSTLLSGSTGGVGSTRQVGKTVFPIV